MLSRSGLIVLEGLDGSGKSTLVHLLNRLYDLPISVKMT